MPIELMHCTRRGHAQKKHVLTSSQSQAALVGTVQQFSINGKLLQTSVFDHFLHLLCVLVANAF